MLAYERKFRWWKDLDFWRDRIVKGYFRAMGVYFEPQYFVTRRILSKVIAMTSAIDDTYDAYGTVEKLALVTDAIDRFDTYTIFFSNSK